MKVPRLHAGLVASLQANELPNPVVEVSVVDNPAFRTYEVAAARTLQVTKESHNTARSPPRLMSELVDAH